MGDIKKPTFRAFTIKHTARMGRITTPVRITAAFDPSQHTGPLPQGIQVQALWDTGATGSVITEEGARQLGLVATGMTNVHHAGGEDRRNTFLVNVYLPNKTGIAGVQVTECPDIVGDFGFIVGMDVITQGDFSITNTNGQTTMSFRIPSKKEVDYVVESHLQMYANVSKNQACPCGKTDESGNPIKFKFCCRPGLQIP